MNETNDESKKESKEVAEEKPKESQAATDPAKASDTSKSAAPPNGDKAQSQKKRPGRKPQRRRERTQKDSEWIEKVVAVNRVSKVVKGGKNFSFSALVVVGNGKGKVGFSVGKAREVQDAIQKGLSHAKNRTHPVYLSGTTIPHESLIRFNAAKVFLKPASEGTGVIAGSAVRAVCECAGIKDILTKSLGSQTPLNVVQATMKGLTTMLHAKQEVAT